jgi:hypothetical protein
MLMGEVAALYGYSTQDFSSINTIKRGNAASLPPEVQKRNFEPYIEACTSALNKLPVYKGTVTRCDKNLPDVVLNELIKSGTRTDPAFVSTGLETVPGFGEIVSIISGIKTGREMTMFSLHEGEGEVLFPPGATFKLTKFVDSDGVLGEKGKEHSDLKKFSLEQLKKVTKAVLHFTQK